MQATYYAYGMEPSFIGKVSLQHSHQTSAEIPQKPPIKKRRNLTIFGVTAIILLVIAGIVFSMIKHDPKNSAPAGPASLTLYYNDGKTILWHHGTEASPKTQAPYFVATAESELKKQYGQDNLNRGAWSVTTTLDQNLQSTAEKQVAETTADAKTKSGGTADQAALILQDVKTGQVKALVGGANPNNPDENKVNYATTQLPGGTSMIPFDYAAFIDNTNIAGAGSPTDDTQTPLPGYPCTNKAMQSKGGNCAEDADFRYPGTLSIRYALGANRKVPAIRAMLSAVPGDSRRGNVASINKTLQIIDDASADDAYRCYSDTALTKRAQCYGASAIGDGAYISLLNELHGLSTIANNGKKVQQTTLVSVRLNGKEQSLPNKPKGEQVIKPDTAYILNNILSDPNASYLPGDCTADDCTDISSFGYKFHRYQGWIFAIDPGVTTDGYGASMASWSTRYAAISWIGNGAQKQPMTIVGDMFTDPMTRNIMQAAHAGMKPDNWQQPRDIQTLPAFVTTEKTGYGVKVPSPSTDIYPAWYKQQ